MRKEIKIMNKEFHGYIPEETPNYLFVDDESGEEFFVQADCITDAKATAIENFGEDVRYLGRFSDAEAEWMGYDTY